MAQPNPAQLAARAEEQVVVESAYLRRDQLIAARESELTTTEGVDPTAPARRSALRRSLADLTSAERGLIFGRLDTDAGMTRYIGRVGLSGPTKDSEPLVLDWRTPAARSFYTATSAQPQGVSRRRHIQLDGRVVVGVNDGSLGGEATSTDVVGEAALLAALAQRRTGTMHSSVATLQQEQDDIVRAPVSGVLVVQGGPGTGKTVVALHRVAFLLFNEPDLASRGVLILGPSRRFLDYIAQVLPALGETAVVSTTCDDLIPGARGDLPETPELAEVKGRLQWQTSLENYVASLIPVPAVLAFTIDDDLIDLPIDRVQRAIQSACGSSYHAMRRHFCRAIHEAIIDEFVSRHDQLIASVEEGFEDILAGVDAGLARSDSRASLTGASGGEVDGALTDDDIDRLRDRLQRDEAVAAALRHYWPVLEAPPTLHRLLSSNDLLARYTPWLSPQERAAVSAFALSGRTERSGTLAPSDLPLLDAVAEELGSADEVPGMGGEFLAQRAAARRDWTYGHAVVDEAQELSAMQWKMVARRVPSLSITAVGDIDQCEAPHGHTTWEESIGGVFGDRWRRADLTICYRTPSEVMALTPPVLAAAGSQNVAPRALRSSGHPPWEVATGWADLRLTVAQCAATLTDRWSGGSVGVIASARTLALVARDVPDCTLVSATDAKGLEWDAAVVVDPVGIAAEPRGWNKLYVALTRCTQELAQVKLEP